MNILSGISLITAFFGGMVALFAPCCITFLLPSYLANIFRTRDQVIWMTIVFGLGLATVLVPTALGIRAIGQLFDHYHTQTYVAGGIFMMLLGSMELTGKKITLPMIHLTIDITRRHDPWSIYLMGIFSGITTSCCTPVLAGILTLSFLSPTFVWAALAGISYVLGMLVPLVILSLLLDRIHWTTFPAIRTKTILLGGKHILITDAVAGVVYIIVGVVFSLFALTGRITMGTEHPIEQTLGPAFSVISWLTHVPYVEPVFAVLLGIGIVWYSRKGRKHV